MKPLIALLFAALFLPASCLAQMSGATGVTAPILPRTLIATTNNSTNFPDLYSSPVTKTVKASGGDYTTLQAAFTAIGTDAVNCGEIITVDAGYTAASATQGATAVTYSYACPAGKHVWVRSSGYLSLSAQGTRVVSGDKTNMFKITKSSTAIDFNSGLSVSDGAKGLIVTGMDLELSGVAPAIGVLAGSSTNSSNYCDHIYFDRIYVDTTYATMVNNAIFDGCTAFALTDSVIDHINILHSDACNTYTEAHDFLAFNGAHTVKLVNNYFGGAPTENVFFGGATPLKAGDNPLDIEIRRNTLFKDPTQIPNASTKNILEFKIGKYILVDGNVLQYSYNDNSACGGRQFGTAIDFNVTAQDATCTWCELSDVTFTNNDIQHFSPSFNMQGHSFSNAQYPVEARLSIVNNLFRDENYTTYSNTGNTLSGMSLGSQGIGPTLSLPGPSNISVIQNSFYGTPSNAAGLTYLNFLACSAPRGSTFPNFALINNAVVLDTTKLNGDCGSSESALIADGVFPNSTFSGNVLFNFTQGTGITCANWGSVNPGVCPSGLAAAPTTINSTLGISDYATCAAGSTTPGSSGTISACAITGTYVTDGPDTTAITAAQIEPNDSLKWGVRTP